MKTCVVVAVAVLFAPTVHARAQTSAPIVLRAGDLIWQPAPPVLEPGAQAAVLAGHPAQPGVVTLRVRVPDRYRIAPHRHPVDEYVTVLSGSLCFTIGEQGATAQPSCVGAGGFALVPANVAHSVWASGATEYQIHVVAPFEMTYLNATDDPSKRHR